jgi:hypothetical protein
MMVVAAWLMALPSFPAKTVGCSAPAVQFSNVLTTPAKVACRIARSGEALGLRVDPSAGVPISGLPLESIPVTQGEVTTLKPRCEMLNLDRETR